MNKQTPKYRDFVLMAMFGAIIAVLAFTPLGFIPLPFIKMTIIHIPVILGSLLLGPKKGAVLGLLFGLTSLINNTMTPAITSFTFTPFYPLPGSESGSLLSLIVCFVPRILVGIVPYFVYVGFQKLLKSGGKANVVSLTVAGIAGSLTNTVFVMGLIFVLFRDAYAAAKAIDTKLVIGVIVGIVGMNGVPEAIGAGILVAVLGKILFAMKGQVHK